MIRARFARLNRPVSDNNRQQAFLPAGAEALPNPNGTAPGFTLTIGRALVCAVPGVPGEMKAMIRDQVLPLLARRSGTREVIRSRTIHVVGLGELIIDDRIGRWERSENPAVGLAAHAGLTDVRITGRGADETAAWAAIAAAEEDVRSALAGHILGTDEETLARQALTRLPAGAGLATVEYGTGGALAGSLSREGIACYAGGLVLAGTARDRENFSAVVRQWRIERGATHAVGLALAEDGGAFQSETVVIIGESEKQIRQRFLIPREMAVESSVTAALIGLWNALEPISGGSAPAAETKPV